jgi:hypothetical protein
MSAIAADALASSLSMRWEKQHRVVTVGSAESDGRTRIDEEHDDA